MPPKRKNVSREYIDDSDDDEDTGTKTKRARMQDSAAASNSAPDDEMIPISSKRFVNVRDFKGKILIDIREYYQDNGEWKPGRKGISLSVDQWEALKKATPQVDEKIQNS